MFQSEIILIKVSLCDCAALWMEEDAVRGF